ncbi:MAG: hypothetical protein GXP31_10225 [Kiritimatiellaeota bacterium]|nr:hypothetical protein [Kiritimatiellota bacterium]
MKPTRFVLAMLPFRWSFALLLLAPVFPGATAPCRAADLKIWLFDKGLEGWKPANWEKLEVVSGTLDGVTRFDSQLLSPELDIRAADYTELVVRVQSDTAGGGEVFFAQSGKGLTDKLKARHSLPATGDFALHRIRLTGAPGWEGRIDRVRFDPLNPPGAHVRIDFIALIPKGAGQLLNGGAELAVDGVPIEWREHGGAERVSTRASAPAHSGRWFLRSSQGTWWETRSLDESFLNPVEIRAFARRAPAAEKTTRLRVEARFRDLPGKEIARRSQVFAPGMSWGPVKALFRPPDRAAAVRLRFMAEKGTVDVDDVKVTYGPRAPITDAARPHPGMPAWNAVWIWHPDLLQRDHVRAYLRYDLLLPADGRIRNARIQVTADDGYALSVNGAEVQRTFGERDGWRTPELLDLTARLRPGRNSLFVEVRDQTSAQGFLAEGLVSMRDGREMPFRTDGSWQAATTPDGPWKPARVLGRPPCAPWGALPYRILTPPVEVRAEIAGIPPTLDVPGRLIVRATLTPVEPVRRPVYAELVLQQNGKTLRRVWADRPFFQNASRPGLEGRTPPADSAAWTVALPWSLAQGEATIRLFLHGAEVADPATLRTTFRVRGVPPLRDFPVARVVRQGGMAVLTVNGKTVNPTQALFLRPDPMHLAHAARAGIRVWGVGLKQAGFFEKGFDFSALDETLSAYLEACPDAWLILNLIFDARYQPWWLKQHPEAHVRLEDGSDVVGAYKSTRSQWPSMSSPLWRTTYARVLRELTRHLRQTPFSSRIIGIQPCAGITWEWFHWGAQSGDLVDYSEAGQRDFRRWLRDKYGTDAALQAAWARKDVTLDTARVPRTAARKSPQLGMFFDPVGQRDVIDYNRYQHDVVADNIRLLYGVLKQESAGRLLCGTYYGYVMYLAESIGFNQASGHFALHRVLKCSDTDYGIAPTTYSWRKPGDGPASMTAFGSFALHGRLWWDQADLRTHWADQDYGRPADLAGSIAQLRREVLRALAQGTALQWYDFSNGWIFGDPRIADELTSLQKLLDRRETFRPLPPPRVLAVVVDEEQMGRFDPFRPPYLGRLINGQVEALIRSGVPWRPVLFRDVLEQPELLKHRAFLFLNLFHLDANQRRFLKERVLREGRTAAFVGPVGVLDDRGLDVDAPATLLGCPARLSRTPVPLAAEFADLSADATWKETAGIEFGADKAFAPVFLPQPDATWAVLARFRSGEKGAAMVVRRAKDAVVIWSAAPGLPPEAIRALARTAGLPVAGSSNDVYYVGDGFVGVHARTAGVKTITLTRAGAVREVFRGRSWPAGTRRLEVRLKAGQTALFRTAPPPLRRAVVRRQKN